MTDWWDAVVDGSDHNVVRPGTMEQGWMFIRCDCNPEVWRIWGPAGDVFHCSTCGGQMRHVKDPDGA